MAKDKMQYDVFKGLIHGKQINILSEATLIKEVQARTKQELKCAHTIYVLSDPFDIRKPLTPKIAQIGKVMLLEK